MRPYRWTGFIDRGEAQTANDVEAIADFPSKIALEIQVVARCRIKRSTLRESRSVIAFRLEKGLSLKRTPSSACMLRDREAALGCAVYEEQTNLRDRDA